jgi:hypothetical protein
MSKILILAAMAMTALLSASSASAATWSSNGSVAGTGFTATAPASKLTVTGVAAGFSCATTTATGALFGPTGTNGVDRVADVTPAFSTCRASGFTMTVSCAARGLGWWVTSYVSPVVVGTLNAAANPICTLTVPSIVGCTIRLTATGGVGTRAFGVSYDDSAGVMTVSTSGQSLAATWSSCGTLLGSASGTAAATLTDSSGAALVYRITSAFVPNVVTSPPPPPTTWHSNGTASGTSFTTTAPASRLTVTGASSTIDCTTTTAAGVLYGPSGTVGVNRIGDLTPTFSSCRANLFIATASCSSNALGWWFGNYIAPNAPGSFTGSTSPICTFTVPAVSGCRVNIVPTGGVGGRVLTETYNNATTTITIATSGQSLTAQWSSCGTLFGSASGSAAVTLTDSAGAALVYTVTSAFRPNMTA